VTVNDVRRAIMLALKNNFPNAKIYGEEIREGFIAPCFFVKVLEPTETQMLGTRYLREYPFDVHYFPRQENNNEEMNDIADQLFRVLEYVTLANGDLLHGIKMYYEIVDGVLHFFVTFNVSLRIIETIDSMGDITIIEKLKEVM